MGAGDAHLIQEEIHFLRVGSAICSVLNVTYVRLILKNEYDFISMMGASAPLARSRPYRRVEMPRLQFLRAPVLYF